MRIMILFICFGVLIGCKMSTRVLVNGVEFAKIKPGKYYVSLKPNEKPMSKTKVVKYKAINEQVIFQKLNIDKSYYISKYEVTNRLYGLVMGKKMNVRDYDLPYLFLDLSSVDQFLAKASEFFKRKVYIPTNYEWEIAYRYKNNLSLFYWSNSKSSNKMNANSWSYKNCNTYQNVGKKKPNNLDLFDLNGNAQELCRMKEDYILMGGGVKKNNVVSPEIWFLPFNYIIVDDLNQDKFGLRLVLRD